jgi:hypothetical protein
MFTSSQSLQHAPRCMVFTKLISVYVLPLLNPFLNPLPIPTIVILQAISS